MRTRHSATLFLLVGVLTCSLAEAGEYGGRDRVRAVFLQAAPEAREDSPGAAAPASAEQQRRAHGFAFPEVNVYSVQGDGGNGDDNARRPGRLTPEERRTLRRQINEVGHDIYAPKR